MHRRSLRRGVCGALLSLCAPAAFAQVPLPHPNPSSQNLHGWDVAVFDGLAAVGCPRDDVGGYSDSGSVVLYRRQPSGQWLQEALLQAPDPVADGLFGWSVAVRGERVVVSAPHAPVIGGGGARGAAYVWRRGPAGWVLEARLEGWDLAPFEDVGQAVDIQAGRIVVGSIWAWDQGQNPTGAVYVYRALNGQWLPQTKLFAADRATNDRFGFDLDLDGSRILVGAPYKPIFGPGWDGSAYVFDLTAVNGTQIAQLLPEPGVPTAGAQFGWSVALDGEGAIVSSPFGRRGAFHIFRESVNGFELVEGVRRAEGSQFALDVDYLATDGLVCSSRPGRVFLYRLCRGHWGEVGSIDSPGDPNLATEFGTAHARDRYDIVVGSYSEGLAYAYDVAPYRSANCLPLGTTFCVGDVNNPAGRCPCSNEVPKGTVAGCRNSTGQGAVLGALGTPSLSANDLLFWASDLPPRTLAILYTVRFPNPNLPALLIGDGVSCLTSGPVFSQGVRVSDNHGVALWENLFNAGPGWLQEVEFGLQVYYRDSGGPCGTRSNTSNGVQLRVTW